MKINLRPFSLYLLRLYDQGVSWWLDCEVASALYADMSAFYRTYGNQFSCHVTVPEGCFITLAQFCVTFACY
jgi:hypothetical protein